MNHNLDFTKRLLGYSAAGAAFALAGGNADAAIIVNNTVQSFDVRTPTFANIDFNNDSVNEFQILGQATFSSFTSNSLTYISPISGSVALRRNGAFAHFENGAEPGGTLSSDPNALPVGFLIGPGGQFDTTQNDDTLASTINGSHTSTGGNFPFFTGQIRYIGVRFNLGGGDLFGWIALRLNSDLLSGDVLGFAYDDTGAAIAAGDTGSNAPVPEPSSLALMAAGAAGLVALRRRRKAN